MKTVKEVITELKILAEQYGSDLQFNTKFENGEAEFGESFDFIEKFNFYRSLHSKYLVEMYYSYSDKRFKVIRIDKDKLQVTPA